MANANEHDELISLNANQQNPDAAKPTDFKIEDRDGGHTGDTKAERAALLALSNKDTMPTLGKPIPDRYEVPLYRYGEERPTHAGQKVLRPVR